jgi:hypothetical protein
MTDGAQLRLEQDDEGWQAGWLASDAGRFELGSTVGPSTRATRPTSAGSGCPDGSQDALGCGEQLLPRLDAIAGEPAGALPPAESRVVADEPLFVWAVRRVNPDAIGASGLGDLRVPADECAADALPPMLELYGEDVDVPGEIVGRRNADEDADRQVTDLSNEQHVVHVERVQIRPSQDVERLDIWQESLLQVDEQRDALRANSADGAGHRVRAGWCCRNRPCSGPRSESTSGAAMVTRRSV